MYFVPDIPASSTFYFFFDAYDSNGASVTITGLAVTDIEIYKNGSVTQRSSDNGYTLLDTDGIDFDSVTGLHGFSVDFSDNSDASFYAAGSQYTLNVNAVTIDSQTVRFSYTFRLRAAESSAGTPKADVSHWLGTAAATPTVAGVPEVDITHSNGTAWAATAGYARLDATGSLALTEATATDGSTATLNQLLYMTYAAVQQFVISGTSILVKGLDGTTTIMTLTMDDATNPTQRIRTG